MDLNQAQILLVQSQNDLDAANAQLADALGYGEQRAFELEQELLPPAPPANFADLLQLAINNRPELIGLKFDAASAHAYATAERDLWFPTISAAGAAGLTPTGAPQLGPRYAAGGVNVNIPIFNGHLFGALRTEAKAQAQANDQYVRDLQDNIVRDVRTAWLNANSAFLKIALTDQLLKNAQQALDLAQARYKLGLSSIIELSQAQLNETQAELQSANAKYDYQALTSNLRFQTGQLQ